MGRVCKPWGVMFWAFSGHWLDPKINTLRRIEGVVTPTKKAIRGTHPCLSRGDKSSRIVMATCVCNGEGGLSRGSLYIAVSLLPYSLSREPIIPFLVGGSLGGFPPPLRSCVKPVSSISLRGV